MALLCLLEPNTDEKKPPFFSSFLEAVVEREAAGAEVADGEGDGAGTEGDGVATGAAGDGDGVGIGRCSDEPEPCDSTRAGAATMEREREWPLYTIGKSAREIDSYIRRGCGLVGCACPSIPASTVVAD